MSGRIGPVYNAMGQPMVGANWTYYEEQQFQAQLKGVSNQPAASGRGGPAVPNRPNDWEETQWRIRIKDRLTDVLSQRNYDHDPLAEMAIRVSIARLDPDSPMAYGRPLRDLLLELVALDWYIEICPGRESYAALRAEYGALLKDGMLRLARVMGEVPMLMPMAQLAWSPAQGKAYWTLRVELVPIIRGAERLQYAMKYQEPFDPAIKVLGPLIKAILDVPGERSAFLEHGAGKPLLRHLD
ncbi:hypothetical protein [uncultured Stenotrophomonas sp.]|uniref:hypothetical protein n=1 Tax=uncultured Stenotrophomonas sp. TaxID=165438 RepID=UPI0025F9F397|nr:hypothetical protein [uncultured Stenotrophomonas sp.]